MYKQMYEHEDLENLTEELVFEELHKLIEGGEALPADAISLQDIVAITLNNVPAKYVTSFVEKLNPRDQQLKELESIRGQAKAELRKAVDIVKQRPHT
ncbi:MAG: late competence development ComFB family protein [Gammaproteobacteria bacterium]|nr:late competence development ComFB family protein [Gammaproteobacteria bacterium]